ncbi:hypothetical protein ACRALDRAFT_206590 [Sodiomyces alcalophilus JCM 7366]|uniref:uncharacterized protein n=1 Tax=Sodiomyces alcalophilus JCM 7366 TaxID=591952 RepID=UPI0039B6E1C8
MSEPRFILEPPHVTMSSLGLIIPTSHHTETRPAMIALHRPCQKLRIARILSGECYGFLEMHILHDSYPSVTPVTDVGAPRGAEVGVVSQIDDSRPASLTSAGSTSGAVESIVDLRCPNNMAPPEDMRNRGFNHPLYSYIPTFHSTQGHY